MRKCNCKKKHRGVWIKRSKLPTPEPPNPPYKLEPVVLCEDFSLRREKYMLQNIDKWGDI